MPESRVTIFNDGERAVVAIVCEDGRIEFESFCRKSAKIPKSVEEFQKDFPRNATFEFNLRRDGEWDFFQAGMDEALAVTKDTP
jgi:hypothetical protein